MRRLSMVAIAFLIPLAGVMAGTAGPAGASSGVTCTQLVYNQLTNTHPIEFRGCSDTQNTGGSGKTPESTFAKDGSKGAITWSGTGSTTVADAHFTYPKPDVCAHQAFEADATFKVTEGTGKAKNSIPAGWTFEWICVGTRRPATPSS